jgi:uncharacterized protein (DUF1778 family)
MEDKVQIGFTVDREVKALLEQLADAEHRSMTNYIETIIRREAESKDLPKKNAKSNNARK